MFSDVYSLRKEFPHLVDAAGGTPTAAPGKRTGLAFDVNCWFHFGNPDEPEKFYFSIFVLVLIFIKFFVSIFLNQFNLSPERYEAAIESLSLNVFNFIFLICIQLFFSI